MKIDYSYQKKNLKEALDLIAANPDLPVYVRSDDLCESEPIGEITTAYITKVIKYETINGDKIFECEYDDDELSELIWGKEPFASMPDLVAEEEIEKHIRKLDWQKVIIITVQSPEH